MPASFRVGHRSRPWKPRHRHVFSRYPGTARLAAPALPAPGAALPGKPPPGAGGRRTRRIRPPQAPLSATTLDVQRGGGHPGRALPRSRSAPPL